LLYFLFSSPNTVSRKKIKRHLFNFENVNPLKTFIMAFNETGHYKNVANLNLLNGYIISYGATYAPTKEIIKLTNLQALYLAGHDNVEAVQTAKNNYSQKVDDREDTFKNIKTFSTRVIANLSGTNVSAQTIKDAKSINAKIQASKASKPKTDPENPEMVDPTAKTHSTSRQSYDSLYENFSDMVNLLTITNGYDTNQAEFQIAELTAFAQKLKTANEKINDAVVEVTNKRIQRDNLLYTPANGLVDAALEAKKYIKGLFGASSPQFKTINSISFKNNK
jgi:hypothetical protein